MMVVDVVPVGHRVARWIRAYGSAEYYAPERYRSSDGTVPWPRFLLLEGELQHLEAAEQLRIKQGVEHGYREARGDSGSMARLTEDLIEQAHPAIAVRRIVRIRADEEM